MNQIKPQLLHLLRFAGAFRCGTGGLRMDILCLGELLVDMVAREGEGLARACTFDRHAGGAAANVAAQVQKLGGSAGFLGKVGQDAFGEYLAEHLRAHGVSTGALRLDPKKRTTVAFIALDEDKAPQYLFYRDGGACVNLRPDEVDEAAVREAECFYFSSIVLTASPLREAARHALELARRAGACVAFDLNYRSTVWPGPDAALRAVRKALPLVDIFKLNTEELRLLCADEAAGVEACAPLFREYPNLRLILLTDGKRGSWVASPEHPPLHIPTTDARPVDTTGAGDSYMAAFLYAYLRGGMSASPEALRAAGLLATRAAEHTIQRPGAIDAMPTAEDLGLCDETFGKR